MNIGGGEAADQMVRMMLTGTEVTVRLGASALKNLLAITLALAKHHKTLSGKVNMGKMLRETRDIRMFPMSPEQYQALKQRAVKQTILISPMRDSVIREERTPKKESRSEFDLAGISGSSSISKSETSTETTHERPSVLAQLKGYREQLDRQHKAAPARSKQKGRPKQR